jgi:hypothetical protein
MKPLLFLAESGTMGDMKPVAILAVIAARSSKLQVTFVHTDHKKFLFLEKFTHFMLGDNHENLIVLKISEFNKSTMNNYFSIGCNSFYTCRLDFGDNGFPNRFVSCLLSQHAPHVPHFGSLYLPLRLSWSNHEVLLELQQFREHHRQRKILILAGSLRLPFSYEHIFEWLEKNQSQNLWAFILIGYNNLRNVSPEFFASANLMDKYFYQQNDTLLILKDYVEYEDIVKYGDAIITNCGAGSIFTPLAQGIPETCSWVGDDYIEGYDKKNNMSAISKFGPNDALSFEYVLETFIQNFPLYKMNAQKAASYIKQESELMLKNMDEFFYLLSTDLEMQKIVEETGKIPEIFALPECLSNKRQRH